MVTVIHERFPVSETEVRVRPGSNLDYPFESRPEIGQTIEVAPGTLVECEARAFPGEVVLTVADRGPGIAESARRRVFDPFYSTKQRGTGLGLAVSKQIIDEHRGRVRMVPRPGGGTRVVIELPIG